MFLLGVEVPLGLRSGYVLSGSGGTRDDSSRMGCFSGSAGSVSSGSNDAETNRTHEKEEVYTARFEEGYDLCDPDYSQWQWLQIFHPEVRIPLQLSSTPATVSVMDSFTMCSLLIQPIIQSLHPT